MINNHNPDLSIFFLELFNISVERPKFHKAYFFNESKLAQFEILEYIEKEIEEDNISFANIPDTKKVMITFVGDVKGKVHRVKRYTTFKTQTGTWQKSIIHKLEKLFIQYNEKGIEKISIEISIKSLIRDRSFRLSQKLASMDRTNLLDDFFYGKYSIETGKRKLKEDLEKYFNRVFLLKKDINLEKKLYFMTLPFSYIPCLDIDNLLDFNYSKALIFEAIDDIFDSDLDEFLYPDIEILAITLLEKDTNR